MVCGTLVPKGLAGGIGLKKNPVWLRPGHLRLLAPPKGSLKPHDAPQALCWGSVGIQAWEVPAKLGRWGVKLRDTELASAKLPAPKAWVHLTALIPTAFLLLCFGDSPQSNRQPSVQVPRAQKLVLFGFMIFFNCFLLTVSFFCSAQSSLLCSAVIALLECVFPAPKWPTTTPSETIWHPSDAQTSL